MSLTDLHRADPRDIAAATGLVDYALDRDNASETYRSLNRDRMIRGEIEFARFARETKESREARRQPAPRRAA